MSARFAWLVLAEYAGQFLTDATASNGQNQGTVFYHGGYVEALYFLTGEHQDYLRRRDAAADDEGLERLPEGTQSAGGMPERIKCLHALVAHELAVPGVNAFGREALAAAGEWWSRGPCVQLLGETT